MKSVKAKRILCFVVAAMTVLSLAACGTGGKDSGATAEKSDSQATTQAAGQSSAPKEVVKLQALQLPSSYSGVFAGWQANFLKENVGVEMEFLPCGDQGEQKLQVYMASGELPDIVAFKTYKQVQDAVAANLIVNLDDHMDKLPNVAKNAATALQYVRDQASNGTGKAYTIPTAIGPSDQFEDPNYLPTLRWDLYKKLGMPEIKTFEDYLPVLQKMVELEPQNADGQKTYAMSLWKDWDATEMYLGTSLAPFYGINDHDLIGGLPFLEYNFNTGDNRSILDNDSQYVRALKFYNTAYKMGLVDPDSLTQTWDAAYAKYESGRVLFGWWGWIGGSYSTRERTDAEPPKGFAAVVPNDYKGMIKGNNPIGVSWCNSIGASTKHLDACLAYVDALYNVDYLQTLYNGPQGETWDMDSSNIPYVTDKGWDIFDNNKELPEGGKQVSDLNSVFGLTSAAVSPKTNFTLNNRTWPKTEEKKRTKLSDDWAATVGYKNSMAMLKGKNMYTETPLWVSLIAPMDNSFDNEISQIGDIIKANSWAMVFEKDQAKFDKYLKDMQDKAKTIGIDKILDYDRNYIKAAQDLASKYNK